MSLTCPTSHAEAVSIADVVQSFAAHYGCHQQPGPVGLCWASAGDRPSEQGLEVGGVELDSLGAVLDGEVGEPHLPLHLAPVGEEDGPVLGKLEWTHPETRRVFILKKKICSQLLKYKS